jgi:xylan 1,4-beta-xylosidase
MIAYVISQCLPNLQAMSHWALSGTYEEIGVPSFLLKEGDNGFPAMFRGIARPNFNTYKLLHALGHRRLRGEGPVLASAGGDGRVAALVWNLADVPQAMGLPQATSVRKVVGSPRQLDVRFHGARPGARVRVRFVDQQRGSPMPAWRAMGSPALPTAAQIAALRQAADIAPATVMRLDADARLSLTLPPEGVALIEL